MRTHTLIFGWILGAIVLGLVSASAQARADWDRWNDGTQMLGHPFLGVVVRDVPYRFRKRFKLGPNEGALVTRVQEDSPADTAGILVGDIILTVDGKAVRGAHDLIRKIRRHRPGDEVVLDILENGQHWQARVTLSCAPGNWPFYFNFPEWRFERKEEGAWLGVKLQTLDEDLARYFHVKPTAGVLIVSVDEGSPAERAGLKAGDILTQIASEPVRFPEDVQDVLSDFHPGQRVKLTIIRHGKEKEMTVRLGRKSSQNRRYFFRFDWPRFYTKPRLWENPR